MTKRTKERILETGRIIWRDEGLQHVTARRIARDLDLTHGCVGYHFKGQKKLHDAIALHAVAARDARMIAILKVTGYQVG